MSEDDGTFPFGKIPDLSSLDIDRRLPVHVAITGDADGLDACASRAQEALQQHTHYGTDGADEGDQKDSCFSNQVFWKALMHSIGHSLSIFL